jgi:hypothetical protein
MGVELAVVNPAITRRGEGGGARPALGGWRDRPPRWAKCVAQLMPGWARSQEIILSELNRNFGNWQGFRNLHKEI